MLALVQRSKFAFFLGSPIHLLAPELTRRVSGGLGKLESRSVTFGAALPRQSR